MELGVSHVQNLSSLTPIVDNIFDKYNKNLVPIRSLSDHDINKALLESVAQITEMTKSDHPAAAARVKSADKMVMLLPLSDGSKPEVAKQHYEIQPIYKISNQEW